VLPRAEPLPVAPVGDLPATPRWRALADRFHAWRDGLLASPAFRSWAVGFVPARFFARRSAGQLFDLVAGFVYSQVLLAAVRLRLFELLAAGPLTTTQLAPRLGLTEDATLRLLAAAASLKLVRRRSGQRWGLGPLGAPMVGNAAVAAMVEHHATFYADLRDPVALLRGEVGDPALARYWPYADGVAPGSLPAERVAEYSALMSATQPLIADQVLDAHPFARHKVLLDVGGGEGTFLRRVAQRVPSLQLMLFDLPAVAERARGHFATDGLAGRASVHGGSFFEDALPTGADLVSLVRVAFDHSDARVLQILCAVRRAIAPGGVLLLAEPMSATPGAQAMGDAYFGFYLLAMGKGRPRSLGELTRLLEVAGFDQVSLLPTHLPLQTQVIRARPAQVNPAEPSVKID
jgi:demethylspheroidene O-methyltransferase